MMKFLLILALAGCAVAQQQPAKNKFAGEYVWDLLKPALTIAEINTLLASKDITYPTYAAIPQTSFSCASKAQPGFYADVDAQCQVYHRCEQGGNQTDYLCVNGSVFNQITLVCDYWFNVDCARSIELEDFANSRLYTNLPLFDSPPADYIAPSQKAAIAAQGAVVVAQPVAKAQPTPVKKPVAINRGGPAPIKASGRAESSGSSDEQKTAPVAETPDQATGDKAGPAPVAAAGRADAAAPTDQGTLAVVTAPDQTKAADHDEQPEKAEEGDHAKAAARRKRRSMKL